MTITRAAAFYRTNIECALHIVDKLFRGSGEKNAVKMKVQPLSVPEVVGYSRTLQGCRQKWCRNRSKQRGDIESAQVTHVPDSPNISVGNVPLNHPIQQHFCEATDGPPAVKAQ